MIIIFSGLTMNPLPAAWPATARAWAKKWEDKK